MPSTISTRGIAARKSHARTHNHQPSTTSTTNIRSLLNTVNADAVIRSSCQLDSKMPASSSPELSTGSATRKRKRSSTDQPIESTYRSKRLQATPRSSQPRTPTKTQASAGENPSLPTPKSNSSQHNSLTSPSINTNTPTRPTPLKQAYATPPSTPSNPSSVIDSFEFTTNTLPPEFDSLIQLNTAFLKALSLHVAHFGTTSPTDIHNLASSVSKIWGKRNVTLEDIRCILGILQFSSPGVPAPDLELELDLRDYGQGSVCLEITVASPSCSLLTPPINEQKLSGHFLSNLRQLWCDFLATSEPVAENNESQVLRFKETLPWAQLLLDPSAASSHTSKLSNTKRAGSKPTLGQSRLTQLFSIAKPQSSKSTTDSATTDTLFDSGNDPSGGKSNLQSRQSSLAQRLMQKSKLKAATVESSPEDIARRAALQRLPEVVAIISADAFKSAKTSQDLGDQDYSESTTCDSSHDMKPVQSQRKTYNFTALSLKIQESARGILAKEEVRQCLELLDKENLAGDGFVRIVTIGGRDKGTVVGVVIDVSKRVSLGELTHKVSQQLEHSM